MAYGIFKGITHVYTLEDKRVAEKLAIKMGIEYYVRELSDDEYWKRMKEIYVDGKYKLRN